MTVVRRLIAAQNSWCLNWWWTVDIPSPPYGNIDDDAFTGTGVKAVRRPSDPGQYLAAVLAETWGRSSDRAGRHTEAGYDVVHGNLVDVRIRIVRDQLALNHMAVSHDPRSVINQATGNARRSYGTTTAACRGQAK